jgi:uncharacterized protein YecT (DUF1311 family)
MQLRIWALTALVGLTLGAGSVPAAAQTGAIARCVAAERKADRDGSTCLERVANPCLEKPEGASTQGQVACIRAESKQWDDLLTSEYRALLASLPPATVAKVREAQRQWLTLRDADCAIPGLLLEGGTMAQPIAASCYLRRTADRTVQVIRWRGLTGR